jgi:predicted cobalt transporter CbtA
MIFQRLIWAALAVAVLVGSVQSGVQQLQAVPIILAAEVFENQSRPPRPHWLLPIRMPMRLHMRM